MWSCSRPAALFATDNVLFLYALSADSWEVAIAAGSIAAQRLLGGDGAKAVSAIIALTILGSVSAMTAAVPGVYYEWCVTVRHRRRSDALRRAAEPLS
ncbi:MAG TPA: hypothetical protein VFQ92_09325 [Blastocatellia bacterium]|nr:hypothetical protein [Blastocatellia bacterium]